jgi:hypothetical protein
MACFMQPAPKAPNNIKASHETIASRQATASLLTQKRPAWANIYAEVQARKEILTATRVSGVDLQK